MAHHAGWGSGKERYDRIAAELEDPNVSSALDCCSVDGAMLKMHHAALIVSAPILSGALYHACETTLLHIALQSSPDDQTA